jgi:hypothetical protein
VNTSSGVLVFMGLKAVTAIDGNVFSSVPGPVGIYSDGVSGTPNYTYTGNREFSVTPAGANISLRPATPATDPDLTFAGAFP